MTNIKVSVILPFRNAASTLARAIESILEQSFENFELILIDDGSKDHSIEIAMNYNDRRIRNIKHPACGIVFSLNKGILLARGKYIARMDADDYSYPDRLLLQNMCLEEDSDVGVVSGLVNYAGDQKKNRGYKVYVDWINQLITPQQIYLNRFVESPLAHPSVMIRKDLFEKYGYYKSGNFPEDYELWLRLMDRGIRFTKLNNVILDWQDDENRLSRNHPNYTTDAFFQVKTKYFFSWYQKFFQSYIPPILVWGTGKSVLQKSRFLSEYDLKITGYIDVQDKKDRLVNGYPVFHYQEIPSEAFILSYVSDRKGRIQIHDFLLRNGFEEGKDFYMMN